MARYEWGADESAPEIPPEQLRRELTILARRKRRQGAGAPGSAALDIQALKRKFEESQIRNDPERAYRSRVSDAFLFLEPGLAYVPSPEMGQFPAGSVHRDLLNLRDEQGRMPWAVDLNKLSPEDRARFYREHDVVPEMYRVRE